MRKLIASIMMVAPLALFAETVQGVVSGAVCGVHGEVCSHKPMEHGFELLGLFNDNQGFFYVANVPQHVFRKASRKEISIEGKVYKKDRTIIADKITMGDRVIWKKGTKMEMMDMGGGCESENQRHKNDSMK